MNARAPAILDHLASLADTTRSRLLLLLDRNELTVSELCGIIQLPQSTVSRHLKALVDGGWITSRAEGTSRLYTMTRDDLDAARRRLWLLVREQVGPTPAAAQIDVVERVQALPCGLEHGRRGVDGDDPPDEGRERRAHLPGPAPEVADGPFRVRERRKRGELEPIAEQFVAQPIPLSGRR